MTTEEGCWLLGRPPWVQIILVESEVSRGGGGGFGVSSDNMCFIDIFI